MTVCYISPTRKAIRIIGVSGSSKKRLPGPEFGAAMRLIDSVSEVDWGATSWTHLLCGGADCIDMQAATWARTNEKSVIIEPAWWRKTGDIKAGHKRNQRMLDTWPVLAWFAFPGGNGTEGMIELARPIVPVYRWLSLGAGWVKA